jgi:hypothetical protein
MCVCVCVFKSRAQTLSYGSEAFALTSAYPRPLNRSQEGVIMKYFAAYTGKDESYNYSLLNGTEPVVVLKHQDL